MKKLLLPFFPLLFLIPAGAQDICIQVIGAAGNGGASLSDKHYAYTVGEVVVATFQGGNAQVTQGFHQPEICGKLDVGAPLVSLRTDLVLHPNPASDALFLRFDSPRGMRFTAVLVDAGGRPVANPGAMNDVEVSLIECWSLPSGTYFLLLTSNGVLMAALPFVKTE